MARRDKKINEILQKISAKERIGAESQDYKLLYNVVGFIPACDFVDNAMLISNLGFLIAKKGLNTCILDLKVFYPNMYQFLNIEPQKRGNGLIKVLKSDKVDFRDELQTTKYDQLYLLSPSPYDLIEEYYDFGFDNLERVISVLKQMFDIVLIDIPNNPPLEFCLGAMKQCHVGFFTASERIEVVANMMKLLDHASSIGISTSKFTSVILMNLLDVGFDYKVIDQSGFNIVAAIPLVKDATKSVLEGRLYVNNNSMMNKYFKKEIERLVELLTND